MKSASPVARLARTAVRRPWLTLGCWLLLTLVALVGAARLPQVLHGGIAAAPGTPSARVERALATHFSAPFTQFLLVVVTPVDQDIGPAVRASAALGSLWPTRPEVRRTARWPGGPGQPEVWVLGLEARSVEQAERLVDPLRAAIAGHMATHPKARALVTGHAAVNLDLTRHAAATSQAAEARAVPLTVVALLLAFGAVVAALAPVVAGVGAVSLAAGLLAALASVTPLVAFAGNVVTMLGLGLGIDYALLVVARVREERQAGRGTSEAVARAAVATAPVIATSACAVGLGLLALIPVPAPDLRAMGVGGVVTVVASALAGVTLLPALAAVAAPWLDAPAWLSARLRPGRAEARWRALAARVTRRPVAWLAAATACLLLLASPILGLRFGLPELAQLPQGPEAVRGLRVLEAQGRGAAWIPAFVLLEAPGPVLTPERLVAVARAAARLRADDRIAEVAAVTGAAGDTQRLVAFATLAGPAGVAARLPEEARWLVDAEGRATILVVTPRQQASYASLKALGNELARWDWAAITGDPTLRVSLGGAGPIENDLQEVTLARFPWVALGVVAATMGALGWLTRSALIPLKAVAATTLTVAAALGATVLALQQQPFTAWLGLPGPLTALPPAIPVLVFCVVFGLTMDYEVFLMARIQDAHRAGHDDKAAIAEGLAATGGVITWAAALMAIVFGAFVAADIVLVKALGLALTLGVVLDATVVRLVLVPATLAIAGRWNWWPGEAARSDGPA
jgi:RND superfamily putative drug exporter